jgi:hypothetical protein
MGPRGVDEIDKVRPVQHQRAELRMRAVLPLSTKVCLTGRGLRSVLFFESLKALLGVQRSGQVTPT